MRRQNSAKSENSGINKSGGKNKGKNINPNNNNNKHIGRRIQKEWTFRVDINKYIVKKRNEAQLIVQKINNVVELETKRRSNGDDESSPLYHHSDDDDNDVSEDEGKSGTDAASAADVTNNGTSNNLYGTRSGEEKLIGGMTQKEIDVMYDSVRTKVSNLTETRNRLINDFSNLTRSERSKRGNMSLASNLRRTPRMHPVGPQDAGKGLSATPRGRSSRIKTSSKYGSSTGGISRRK